MTSPAPGVPESARLRFRPMADDDLDDLDDMARLLGDPVVMAHYPRPRTRGEAADWIAWNRRNYARDGFGLWVIEDLDDSGRPRFVGDCGLTWQEIDGVEHLEVGYHVLAERWGEGLGGEAATAAVAFARDVGPERGVDHVIAIIVPGNAASRRTAEKAGLSFDRETTSRDGQPAVVYELRFPSAGISA